MADINVSLGLDDAKFKQGISRAEQSAKQFGQTANGTAGGAQAAFDRMAQGLDGLNSKFVMLGRAVAAIGIGALVGSLIRGSEAIMDVSGSLGIAVDKLKELEFAAGRGGVGLDNLTGMLGRMQVNLQAGIEGSDEMVKALNAVGVSAADIRNKTPDQVFNQIALALSSIEDPGKRSALAVDLFGKAGLRMDWKGFREGLLSVSGTLKPWAKSIEEADKLGERFGESMGILRGEFLKIISPVMALITPTGSLAQSFGVARIAALALTVAMAGLAGGAVLSGIKNVVGWTKELAKVFGITVPVLTQANAAMALFGLLGTGSAASQTVLAGALARVATATMAVNVARAELAALEASGTASAIALAAAVDRLTAAEARLATMTTAASATIKDLAASTLIADAAIVKTSGTLAAGGGIIALLGKLKWAAAAAAGALALFYSTDAGEADEDQKIFEINKGLSTLTKEQIKNYFALSAAEKLANEEKLRSLGIAKMQEEQWKKITGPEQTGSEDLVGNKAKEAAKKLAEFQKAERESIIDVINGYKRGNEERERGLRFQIETTKMMEKDRLLTQMSERDRAVLNAQYEAEKDLINDINALKDKAAKYARGTAEEKTQVKALYDAAEQLRVEYEKHIPVVRQLADEYITLQERRQLNLFSISEEIRRQNELLNVQDNIAKIGMTSIEQKYQDIDIAARNSAKAAIEAEQARRGALLSPDEQKAYYDTAFKNSDKLKARHRDLWEQSRTFAAGWKTAFANYSENATNAALQAQRIFSKATQGMEDAIVNFAKTGKFEFRNFLQMMVEELLRSQIQQLFAKMLGGVQNQMGAMRFMPGESGGMPTGGGLSIGGIFSGVTSAIGSVVGGIGKLFGGFFANGGTLGAGKWGIAGENGPELISGPATVTPMNGSATYVTYNINAVDALSFKQMVARDPQFIYAVTQQGAKSIPLSRR
jgi:lambda family phage tail tape measure protein